MPFGIDRRLRGMTRHLSHLSHTRKALAARASLIAHLGRVPDWKPGRGLRTVNPKESR